MPVLTPDQASYSSRVQVLIIGAGACGTIAALAANERGAEVLILEREDRKSVV
jgi:fumarate reductase flavoprotein subunit